MKRVALRRLFIALMLPIGGGAWAEVACPPVFSDHMVLQRDTSVAVWGSADPKETVTVTFVDHTVSTVADTKGYWRVDLPALEAANEPRTLTIQGTNTLTFDDVLVGEVWLCSGQSNMEKPLGEQTGQKPTDDYESAIATANHPTLRLFQVPRYGDIKDAENQMRWLRCSPQTLADTRFSAAAYYFGAELKDQLDVPIGLIHASFGGSMIEAWMPPAAFDYSESLKPLRHKAYFAWVEGVQATELFRSMIEPLAPYSLRGFLWYQGEANVMDGDGRIYGDKLIALIKSWRDLWNQPDASFYFAQIAPFIYSEWPGQKSNTTDALPQFWTIQSRVASRMPNVGIIPTTDLVANVKDIHPTNKRDVGLRFARLALQETYGVTGLNAKAPRIDSVLFEKDGEVTAYFSNASSGLHSSDSQPIRCFEIAGEDGLFFPAIAKIHGDTVSLSRPAIAQPALVRFAWNETANPNLVNAAGLPALPFTTESGSFPTLEPSFLKPTRIRFSDAYPPDGHTWTHWDPSDTTASFQNNKVGFTIERAQHGDEDSLTINSLTEAPHAITVYGQPGEPLPQLLAVEAGVEASSIDAQAAIAYYELDAAQCAEITLQYNTGNLLAIAIDAPNPLTQAKNPTLTLNSDPIEIAWTAPTDARRFRVYLLGGDNAEKIQKAVQQAGVSSSAYLGETANTHFTIDEKPEEGARYYAWRVDSIDNKGNLTRGDVSISEIQLDNKYSTNIRYENEETRKN